LRQIDFLEKKVQNLEMGLTERVVRTFCPCCSDGGVEIVIRTTFFVSALWMVIDWGTDLQTLVATYYPKCANEMELEPKCGYFYGSLVSLFSPSILYSLYMLMARCRGEELSLVQFLCYGLFYWVSAPITVLGLASKAVCCYQGDEQREVDQNKARVLKIFEHIGEALPQLAISLTFLFNEGTYHHPLTVLSAIVSLISLMMGLVTGTLALKKRGLRL